MSPGRLAAKSVRYTQRAVLTLQPASPICSELHLNEEERQTCPGSSLLSRVPCLPAPDTHPSGPRPHTAVSSLTLPVTRWVSLLYTCLECPPPLPVQPSLILPAGLRLPASGSVPKDPSHPDLSPPVQHKRSLPPWCLWEFDDTEVCKSRPAPCLIPESLISWPNC